ncbi:unnamed protein product [Adineta steineri]|uniref:Uncharacterized protein n=1 Tax=Adineta steineri TaxID=433720 RepID=A0A815L4Z9_9BILA|nr:unnamed protein product [Adineta steineri]
MGCRQSILSSPNPNPAPSSSLSSADSIELEEILAEIPIHCRQPLINLPVQQFLNVYQHHLVGKYYFGQNKFLLAIAHEFQAMSQLGDMMPNHKDHFIFVDICNIVSSCFLELHVVEGAVLTSQWALNITEKYTPTDYKTISYQYSRLGIAYQAKQAWKEARYYLTKAIDTTRLTNEIDEEYIRKLEADFDLIKNRIIDNTQVSMTAHEIKPNPGENMEDFCRRAITEMIACNAEHSTLSFFKSEFERLPNKQTESEVNDEILNEVSQNLENCVRVSALDTEEVNFIAAQFKNMCMKASPLLPAIIEAALTTIIDRIKDENSDADNEQFISLKQSAFIFSYTDESENYKKGVRVFEIRKKIESNDEQ